MLIPPTLERRWEFPCPKSAAELVTFLQQHVQIKKVNLTNKSKQDDLVAAVKALRSACPDLDVCAHYAISAQYGGSAGAAADRLLRTLQALAAAGATSVLLVSGGGARRRYDTLAALRQLAVLPCAGAVRRQRGGAAVAAARLQPGVPPLYVAFNPYLPPGDGRGGDERARLRSKLLESGGLVHGVYLQAGSDAAALDSGLSFLSELLEEATPSLPAGRPAVYGSVLVPSARLLAQLRFRPWRGVLLSQQFLGSVLGAEAAMLEVLQVYRRHGVVPLVESGVGGERELQQAERQLGLGGL